MNRTDVLRRAAAAAVISVAATVVTVAGASPAHAEAASCAEYKELAHRAWGSYFAEMGNSWNTDILLAAGWLRSALAWEERVGDVCY